MNTSNNIPKSKLKIIAVIPCLNTENTIASMISKNLKYVDEVIVIDDGSQDKTAEVARISGAKVISHGINRGYGSAIKSGFSYFQHSDSDILVTIDGDGQHNPDEIPTLVNPLLEGSADVVIGSRFKNNGLKMPRYRKLGIGVITLLWNFGSKVTVTDTQSGFRAYNKKILMNMDLSEKGMSSSIEILEKIRKNGARIKEIPISCAYTNNNTSLNLKATRHGYLCSPGCDKNPY